MTKNSTADFKLTQHCKTTILQLVEVYSPWNSPGQNTGVDSLSPLQGIFPTQGSNPGLLHGRQILYQQSQESNQGLLHCRCILYQLSYQGCPEGSFNSKKHPASATMSLLFSLCSALPLPVVPRPLPTTHCSRHCWVATDPTPGHPGFLVPPAVTA